MAQIALDEGNPPLILLRQIAIYVLAVQIAAVLQHHSRKGDRLDNEGRFGLLAFRGFCLSGSLMVPARTVKAKALAGIFKLKSLKL